MKSLKYDFLLVFQTPKFVLLEYLKHHICQCMCVDAQGEACPVSQKAFRKHFKLEIYKEHTQIPPRLLCKSPFKIKCLVMLLIHFYI